MKGSDCCSFSFNQLRPRKGDLAAAEVWLRSEFNSGALSSFGRVVLISPNGFHEFKSPMHHALRRMCLLISSRQAEEVGIKPTLKMLNLAWKFCAHTILSLVDSSFTSVECAQHLYQVFDKCEEFHDGCGLP